MDESIALDLNGKATQRLRLVRGAVVAAWADGMDDGQFLMVVDPTAPCNEQRYRLLACPQEIYPVAGCYPSDVHVGIYEAA